MYTGSHISKTQAKQKACENFLRVKLEKKMREPGMKIVLKYCIFIIIIIMIISIFLEVKSEYFTETDVEVNSENGTSVKPYKGPPMEDFPWPQFVSLAMHNLISHWDLQPATTKVLKKKPKVAKVNIYILYIFFFYTINSVF